MSKLYPFFARLGFALLLLLLMSPVVAQRKVYLGLKTGMNFSRINQREYYNYNDPVRYGHDPAREPGNYNYPVRMGANPNLEMGLVMNIGSDSLFFQPELLLVQKGYKAYGVYEDENGRQNMNSYEQWQNTYIEMPLLGKFVAGKQKASLFVAAGPSIGYWQDSYYKRNVSGVTPEKTPYDFQSQYLYTVGDAVFDSTANKMIRINRVDSVTIKENRKEISAVLAAGFQVKVNKNLLLFDLRYTHGFTDLFRYKHGHPANTDRISNRRLTFSFSYLFSL
ncbi:MAG: PorT family protein [Hymenobacteraceae bacterium]|nr:PorT family protein [Hymenobacteraceae bacterium]